MKKLFTTLALFAICSTTALSAQDSACNECVSWDFCCSDLSYSAYVDYLYWKVNRSDTYFDDGEDKYLCPSHSHNYRVGAAVHRNCFDLGFRYTSFDTSDSRDSHKYSIDFDMLDLEAGYLLTFDCVDATFRPFAGVKFVWVDQKWDDDDFEDDFDAIGIYTGIESIWQLCNKQVCNQNIGVSLVFRGSTGLLEGSHDYHFGEGKECLYTFVNDLFFGANLEMCDLGCVDTNIQIGYEIQNYTNWAQFFGFSGLVLRFGAAY